MAISLLSLLGLGTVACGGSDGLTSPVATQAPAATSAAATIIATKGSSTPTTTAVSPPTTAPTVEPPVEATTGQVTAVPEDPAIAQEQEAVRIMWEMINQFGETNETAVALAGRNGHPGLVPVLVEAAGRTFDVALAAEIARALEKITGERVGGDFVLVAPWFSWMSRQDPPQQVLQGYDSWRGQVLGAIDASFREFIYADVPTRIPLWTVQWGGVVRDGIPPLEFPKTVSAAEVDFLLPGEPVFGVTINGESRAYPHRIMGWHELANDWLGGELISFVF